MRLVRGGQSLDTFDAQAPRLSAVGVTGDRVTGDGATGDGATVNLAATSDTDATSFWLLVAQGSAAPTAAEVMAGVNYGTVTVVSSRMVSMLAGAAKSFSVSVLSMGTAYDLYLVGYDDFYLHRPERCATKQCHHLQHHYGGWYHHYRSHHGNRR